MLVPEDKISHNHRFEKLKSYKRVKRFCTSDPAVGTTQVAGDRNRRFRAKLLLLLLFLLLGVDALSSTEAATTN
jgi:hypothetical protein